MGTIDLVTSSIAILSQRLSHLRSYTVHDVKDDQQLFDLRFSIATGLVSSGSYFLLFVLAKLTRSHLWRIQ